MHTLSDQSLAGLQARIATALLAADPAQQQLPEALFTGAHPGAAGLRVHRHTILGAISHALRMSFAAVDRLVGEDFFDRMAVAYGRAMPPAAPQLDAYGSGFPAFIADFPGTEGLPYLSDLAHFEWQLDELARLQATESFGARALTLEGGVRLHFLASLRVHHARYPVDALRLSILAEDTAALGAIGLQPDEHAFALWRARGGVKVLPLSATAARFLTAALAGAEGAQALAAAAAGQDDSVVAAVLAREILSAGFVRIATETP
jgi:hypothetical protein